MQAKRQHLRCPCPGLLLLLLWLCLPATAQTDPPTEVSPEVASSDWEILKRAPGEGQECLVCEKVLGPDMEAVSLRYRGREFTVGGPVFQDFVDDPYRYFSKLQPRSALFAESATTPSPLASGWLWFGVYVLTGLVFGGLASYTAVHKGLSPVVAFFLGLVLSVAGWLIVVLMPGSAIVAPQGVPSGLRKVPTTHAPQVCGCGAENHPSSSECSACGAVLVATVDGEVARAL